MRKLVSEGVGGHGWSHGLLYKASGGRVTVISRQPTRGKVILNMMIIPDMTIPNLTIPDNKGVSMVIPDMYNKTKSDNTR